MMEHEEAFYSYEFYLCGGQKWGLVDEEKKYKIADVVDFLRANCNGPEAVHWVTDMLEQ